MQSNHKKYIQDKGGWYFFKNNGKTVRNNSIYGHPVPGGQIPKYSPNMTPNIVIMKITSQFGPFDSKVTTKIHLGQNMMVFLQNEAPNSWG